MHIRKSYRFNDELEEKLQNIKTMPYMYRQSKKANDKNIRDMVFKKYVIPYKVKEDEILVLGIFSQNIWEA